jgi:hypothetical protein
LPQVFRVFICRSLFIFQFLFSGAAYSSSVAAELSSPCGTLLQARQLEKIEKSIPQLAKFGEFVIKKFDPRSFQIIVIGRSPGIVSAYLKANVPDYVQNLPLSGFRARLSMTEQGVLRTINASLLDSFTLTPADVENLYSHFDKYLRLDSNKDIVLLDYATSGATLASVYFYFHQYLERRRISKTISICFLASARFRRTVIYNLAEALQLLGYFSQAATFASFQIDGDLGQLVWSADNATQFDFSEFGRFNLQTDHPKPPNSSKVYQELVQFFQTIEDE